MAIDFTRSSSQYLTASVAPITTTPCTLACWFKADDITAQHVLLSVMDDGTGSVDGFYIQAVGNTAGDPIRASVAAAGSFGEAATTTGYSANTWQHACGVYTSATSRAAFLNGDGKGTSAANRAPSGLSRTMVGRYNAGASNVYSDAAIAEAAIWDTDLTDAEVAILATGVSPLFVRPQNLVFYAPLSGSNATETDIIGGASITWINTPTKAEHPRIIRPSAKILTFPSAGGGTNNYTLSGSVTHTLTPAASFAINRAYSLSGAVSYTLTPSATLEINRAYTLSGAVTLSLTPSASMAYTAAGSASITGAVTYTLTPGATFAINRAYTLTGAVTHTLSVAASMQYTAQQAIEFVGGVTYTLTPQAVMVGPAVEAESASLAGLRVHAAREMPFFFSKQPTRRRTSRASWPTLRAA